jgi:tetrapyrrole methylase family protein/MazG family protein
LLTRQAWAVLARAGNRAAHVATDGGRAAGAPSAAASMACRRAASFDAVYDRIAEEVVQLGARRQGVIYAVPGHPLVGEGTVTRILARAREERIAVEIVAGLSFVEPVLALLGVDALDGLQVVDAAEIAHEHHPPLNTDVPALLGQVYSRALAGDAKLTLMNAYPPEHPVTLVQARAANAARAGRAAARPTTSGRWRPRRTDQPARAGPADQQFRAAETVARLRPGNCRGTSSRRT